MKKAIKYIFLIAALVTGVLVYNSCTNFEKEYEADLVKYPEITIADFSPKSGRPGEQVTITGTNFGDYSEAASISFNGVLANDIVSYADQQIVARVPADAGTGFISVAVWTHLKEFTEEFTFVPGAKITSLSPSEGEAGDEITIKGESFGSNASDVTVYFENGEGGIEAEVVSVTDTEIKVIVPDGGITGAIRLEVGPQSIVGPVFTFPFAPIEFMFDTPGDAEGWTTSHSSTSTVNFGVVRASYNMGASKRRADFAHTGGMTVHAGVYPIVAIRIIDKPASGNFIFDTNLGKYKNGSNNWEGIIKDNIYYYDLRNTFGADNTLSQTEETTLTTFQWKVADITTDEKNYFVDWVKSFSSVAELEAFVAEQHLGQRNYGFTEEKTVTPDVLGDWIGRLNQPGTTTVIEDGYEKVTFETPSDGSSKVRADFNYSHGGDWGMPGSGIKQAPWQYSPEYPIYAIKLHFVQSDGSLGGPRPAQGTVKYDRLGNFDNTYADSHNVLWVDGSGWGGDAPKTEGSWWAVVIADILSDELGYWVDWHRTYRSVEEMEFYLGIE